MIDLYAHLEELDRRVKDDRERGTDPSARVASNFSFGIWSCIGRCRRPEKVSEEEVQEKRWVDLITKKVQIMTAVLHRFQAVRDKSIEGACEVQLHGYSSTIYVLTYC
jgi:hypothetical protein